MLKLQDLKDHPCYFSPSLAGFGPLSHRSGGFGGTCERCGTEIQGSNNEPINSVVSWTPIPRPQPYQPGSLNEAIYKLTHSTAVTDKVAGLLFNQEGEHK